MSVKTLPAAADGPSSRFESIYAELPPLGSLEYFELLESATVAELPAQVLARAFRELAAAGSTEAANATLLRLVADKRFDYLGTVRRQAASVKAKSNFSFDDDDLVQETIQEIVRTLPTIRGRIAEGAWVRYINHRFADAWRNFYGRHGEKDPEGRVGVYVDEKTGIVHDPVEEADGEGASWHTQLRKRELAEILEILAKFIEKLEDPLIRYVMTDQLGDDPSPISAGKSEGGRAPLTEQLGIDRFKISRAIKSGKARLAADLLRHEDLDIDMEWLRKFAGK